MDSKVLFTVVHVMLAMYTKLEWLVNCSHNTDYLPVWGSLRLAPIIIIIVLTAFNQIHAYLLGVEVTHYQELTW